MVDEARDVAGEPPDLAGAVFARTSKRPAKPTRRKGTSRPSEAQYSGPGKDERDPMAAGAALDSFIDDQGWRARSQVAAAMANWDQVAGPDMAAHVAAESFDDGVLTLRADSTAWATQVRLLLGTVRTRIDQVVGVGVVTKVVVRGPEPPKRTGAWRVPGRGPRDTYG